MTNDNENTGIFEGLARLPESKTFRDQVMKRVLDESPGAQNLGNIFNYLRVREWLTSAAICSLCFVLLLSESPLSNFSNSENETLSESYSSLENLLDEDSMENFLDEEISLDNFL